MRVLLLGSGGREHALAWKLSKSPLLTKLYCAPGSAGIEDLAQCVSISPTDFKALASFCHSQSIDLVVVGPEAPLAAGVSDELGSRGIKVFGPKAAATRLESSKVFAKEFMARHGIPTADFKVFMNARDARGWMEKADYPVVLKADGLAAGKGVRVCHTKDEANEAVVDFMEKRILGSAGDVIVAEKCLKGREVSVMVLCDGKTYLMLPPSRDHKRVFDGDAGPNTGGMGAFSPVPDLGNDVLAVIRSEILDRTVNGLINEKMHYCGVIYAGIMLTDDGPKVLEFNCRFGDPETQSLVPLLESDLLELLDHCAHGNLCGKKLEIRPGACVCVVLASKGYPGKPETGKLIQGPALQAVQESAGNSGDVILFHSGTSKRQDGWYTSGGRVLGVTAAGENFPAAREKAYKTVEQIRFEGMHYRKDIGVKI